MDKTTTTLDLIPYKVYGNKIAQKPYGFYIDTNNVAYLSEVTLEYLKPYATHKKYELHKKTGEGYSNIWVRPRDEYMLFLFTMYFEYMEEGPNQFKVIVKDYQNEKKCCELITYMNFT